MIHEFHHHFCFNVPDHYRSPLPPFSVSLSHLSRCRPGAGGHRLRRPAERDFDEDGFVQGAFHIRALRLTFA